MEYVEGPNSAKVLAIRQTVFPRQRNSGGNGHSSGESVIDTAWLMTPTYRHHSGVGR